MAELKIVEVKKIDHSTVIITVEGDNPSALMDTDAKTLAYAARLDHGMSQAGISSEGGIYPHEKKYRKDFKLWAGI